MFRVQLTRADGSSVDFYRIKEHQLDRVMRAEMAPPQVTTWVRNNGTARGIRWHVGTGATRVTVRIEKES